MDRVTQRRKQSNRLIGQRYLVQTELVSNSTGTLYQARDMRASDPEVAPVLIHIFPAQALPPMPLKLMTERLQTLSANTDATVLKLRDSGWLNAEAYFVLESPPSWNLSALPSMLGQTTRLHQQALQINQRLNEQDLITGSLPTSLFVVTAQGEVYLPSTALAPNLSKLTASPEHLLQAHVVPKPSSISKLPWLAVSLVGVVAASGAGLYYQNYIMTTNEILRASHATLNTPTHLSENPPPVQNATASFADKPEFEPTVDARAEKPQPQLTQQLEPFTLAEPPMTSKEQTLPSPSVAAQTHLPDPEPGDMRVALTQLEKPFTTPETAQPEVNKPPALQDKKPKATQVTTPPNKASTKPEKQVIAKPEPKPEFVEETDPNVNLPSPPSPLIQAAVDTQTPKAQIAATSTIPAAVQVVPAPQPVPITAVTPMLGAVNPVAMPAARLQAPPEERDLEAVTANGMTSDELVKKAYQALQAGQLDEQPNRGAIYFIRLLERIDHGNPQITRLARETGYQLHQQVRTALIQGDSEQASQRLWRAGRIIKEFNLVHLNPAQELLEHKLTE